MNFQFEHEYILENEKALLRPLEKADVENLLDFSVKEPEIWQYSMVQAIGKEGLENYLNLAINAREQEKEYPFIVYDKLTKAYAGSTRFYDIQIVNECLQIGYTWYGKKYQGTGLNKNCKYLLLEFAFENLGVERIEFRADVLNERSIAAMKSIGCTVEGILRRTGVRPNGNRRDSMVLSILKDDWENDVKVILKNKLI
jgi:N-acetyltransferase